MLPFITAGLRLVWAFASRTHHISGNPEAYDTVSSPSVEISFRGSFNEPGQ